MNRGFAAATIVLALAAAGQSGLIAIDAARVGDYQGIRPLLEAVNAEIEKGDVVIADDPRWGTPLALMYGRDAVNGRLLWRKEDEAFRREFMSVLSRLREEKGRRVVWLTSTRDGMSIYNLPSETFTLRREFSPVVYHTVRHSDRGRSFASDEHDKVLAIYDWEGGP
jgi:hypothetical protein